MAYLRDNKEISLKALVARHTGALGTLRSSHHKGEKSAGYVWNKIAGDLGRKHTLGLYLEKPKIASPNNIEETKAPSTSDEKTHLFSNRQLDALGKKQTNTSLKRQQGMRASKRPSHKKLPILHVYLDSQALIQDFSTDAVLYQAKMAHEGLPVQSLKFHLSKKVRSQEERLRQETPHTHQETQSTSLENDHHKGERLLDNSFLSHNQKKERQEAAWILRHKKGAHLVPDDHKTTTPFNELPPLSPTEMQFIQRNVHSLPDNLKRVVISAMSARLRRQKDV